MDIQLRKINFIQEFLRINNESLIEKLENLLNTERSQLASDALKPLSVGEFNALIDKAEEDAISGHYRNVHTLKSDIQSWG